MEVLTKKNKSNYIRKEMKAILKEEEGSCSYCFFCAMKEENPKLRRTQLTTFFNEIMPYTDDQEHVLVMSGLWNLAMTHPDDTELPSLGVFRCMSLLIHKSLADPAWLRRHQNIYIPYYAAHVIGSYTIKVPSFAVLAVEEGVVPMLLELLRGRRVSWVEQRVAIRALGHLASYDTTFSAVAEHREEVVGLAMRLATTCLGTVYIEFVSARERKKYHRDLLTRGLGGVEMENRKAEEWASQLQCWSLYLLSCFACKDRSSHGLICRDAGFLRELCKMWGGLVNDDSPAGVGLMRILCRSEVGREAMAGCREVVESLCNLSRSSDDWQYMGIDCLLLLIEDVNTRHRVMGVAASCLADLAELRSLGARRKLGDTIAKALLLDFDKGKNKMGEGVIRRSLWETKVERMEREEEMSNEEIEERRAMAAVKKQQGNERFWSGDIEGAVAEYTEALELSPLNRRKERVVLYSNKAQCHLLLEDPDAAISDATRALSLSSPTNCHGKSLWRRSQAYDMKGMAKESLMDSIMFVNCLLEEKGEEKRRVKVPYYAARMINKQMSKAGLFATIVQGDEEEKSMGSILGKISTESYGDELSISGLGLPTIVEEPWSTRRKGKKGG